MEKKKTIMVRCPQPDCYNLMPEGAGGCCKEHKRLASRKMCGDCGEKEITGGAQKQFCDDCLRAHRLDRNKRYNCNTMAERKALVPEKPKPKTKPRPIMTDAQQARIDRQVHKRLIERCGLGHGPVKRYTPEEIAAIQGQITPIHQIPKRRFSPENCKADLVGGNI